MSAVVGALRVNLGLNSAQFQKGMGKANKSASRFAKNVGIAMGGAAISVAAGLSILTRRSLSTIDQQAKLAQSLNTTTKSVQIMERAGELAGVAMAGVEQATKDLHRRLSQAAGGTGPAVTALDRLGLSASELMAMPLDERIKVINEAIAEFIPVARQAAVAGQLFGEEGSLAMSRIDPATLERATDEIERFGVAVSEVDAEAIERANDAMSSVGLAARGLGNQLAAIVAPSLERIANLLGDWASRIGKFRVALEGFLRPQTELQIATDNLVLAIGDEIRQTQLLETVLGTSTRLSIDAAREKLTEALARNENVKAIIAEQKALAIGSKEFVGLSEQINDLQAQLNVQGFPSIDAAVRSRADAFEETQQSIARLLIQRQELLNSDKDMSDQLAKTEANITTLTAAIGSAADGYVTLGSVMVDPIEAGERLTGGLSDITEAAEITTETIQDKLVGAVDSISKAFGDWFVRGFKDFKGFANSILNSFKSMIAQMIATAAKNKILISLGLGGSGVAGAASSGGGLLGGFGSSLLGSFGTAGAAGVGLLGGLGGVGAGVSAGFASGGLGGAVGGFFSSTAAGISGGIAAGGIAGIGAAIGAAIPIIGIGLALFSLFKKKPPISGADFAKIQQGLELTNVALLATGRSGQKTAAALKKAAGGMDEFQKQTQFYFDNFITDAEKREKALDALSGVFGGLNLTMPKTAQGFRDIVEGLDLTTKSGQTAYSELLKVAPVFSSVFGSIANAGKSLGTQFGDDIFSTREQMNRTMAALNRGAEIGSLPYGSGVVHLGEVVTVTERMDRLQSETAAASMSSAQTLAQIRTFFQRWDIDGMPEVRPA